MKERIGFRPEVRPVRSRESMLWPLGQDLGKDCREWHGFGGAGGSYDCGRRRPRPCFGDAGREEAVEPGRMFGRCIEAQTGDGRGDVGTGGEQRHREPAGEQDRQGSREERGRDEPGPQVRAAPPPRGSRRAAGAPEVTGGSHRVPPMGRVRSGSPARYAEGAHGAAIPAGRVTRATVPWPGRELILITPSYFLARWPAKARPIPIAPSREV